MKKVFENPEMEIHAIADDIITASVQLCQPSDTGFVPDPHP